MRKVCRNTTTDMANTTRQLLVFDEVDVGISGGTAQVVGEVTAGTG